MMDYKVFDVLTVVEKMLGKSQMYLTDAVKSGKLKDVSLKFDVEKDSNGVPVNVAHTVVLSWVE